MQLDVVWDTLGGHQRAAQCGRWCISVRIVMGMSHRVTMLVRWADDVTRVGRVFERGSRLVTANPLSEKVRGIFDVRSMPDFDLAALETLKEREVATKAVA